MRVAGLASIVVIGLLSAQQASAGGQTGTITNLITRDSDGLTYVLLTGSPSGRASCASGTQYWMIPSENTDSGKRMYSALLAAHLAGRTVIIVGKNTCTRWSDGEDINQVQVQ